MNLSHDVALGIKIDKPIVVYRFFWKRYDVNNNVAYILTKL